MELFPGQVETISLTIEQMRVLGSPIRSEVFYAFTPKEPRSVSEIAKGLGKSAQTVHYHTSELISAELLVAVDERKVRSRTEKLYVHKGRGTYSANPVTASDEYRDEVVNGFYAVARTIGREMDEAYAAIAVDPEFGKLVAYQQNTIRVSAEDAAEIKRRLYELRAALLEFDDPNGEYRVRTAVYMAPSIETSRAATKRTKTKKTKAPQS